MATDALEAECRALLARTGITIPAEQLPDLVAAVAELRTHIARVNAACPQAAPPATIFVPHP